MFITAGAGVFSATRIWVVDMRSFPIHSRHGAHVVYDPFFFSPPPPPHSRQRPGGGEGKADRRHSRSSRGPAGLAGGGGGRRTGFFMEVHDNPPEALSRQDNARSAPEGEARAIIAGRGLAIRAALPGVFREKKTK